MSMWIEENVRAGTIDRANLAGISDRAVRTFTPGIVYARIDEIGSKRRGGTAVILGPTLNIDLEFDRSLQRCDPGASFVK